MTQNTSTQILGYKDVACCLATDDKKATRKVITVVVDNEEDMKLIAIMRGYFDAQDMDGLVVDPSFMDIVSMIERLPNDALFRPRLLALEVVAVTVGFPLRMREIHDTQGIVDTYRKLEAWYRITRGPMVLPCLENLGTPVVTSGPDVGKFFPFSIAASQDIRKSLVAMDPDLYVDHGLLIRNYRKGLSDISSLDGNFKKGVYPLITDISCGTRVKNKILLTLTKDTAPIGIPYKFTVKLSLAEEGLNERNFPDLDTMHRFLGDLGKINSKAKVIQRTMLRDGICAILKHTSQFGVLCGMEILNGRVNLESYGTFPTYEAYLSRVKEYAEILHYGQFVKRSKVLSGGLSNALSNGFCWLWFYDHRDWKKLLKLWEKPFAGVEAFEIFDRNGVIPRAGKIDAQVFPTDDPLRPMVWHIKPFKKAGNFEYYVFESRDLLRAFQTGNFEKMGYYCKQCGECNSDCYNVGCVEPEIDWNKFCPNGYMMIEGHGPMRVSFVSK